ncbi:phage head-tail adaptor [Burkholderiales bacterium GJ-E10]|nr:phage head-tail adaptor [Burkholderiales bacterium GJ-E10]
MPLVSGGRLNQRITIQAMTRVRGPLGGHDETWSDFAVVWAEVTDLSGREIFNAKAMGSAVTKRITIRYRTDILAAMRVVFSDGSMARIEWIRRVSPKLWVELYCLDLDEGSYE